MKNKMRWLETGTVALPALATLGIGLIGNPLEHPWSTIAFALMFVAGIWCLWVRRKHEYRETKQKTEQESAQRAQLEEEYRARLNTQATLVGELSTSTGGLLDDLAHLTRQDSEARGHQLLPTHKQITVELLKVLRAHHEQGRATLYLPKEDGTLTPATCKGRHDHARSFDPETPRGQGVWQFLKNGSPFICNDVDDPEELPKGWEGTASGYKAFVSCPIVVNSDIYGMLTYDVPDARSLTKNDADAVMIYAAIAGLASRVVEGREDESR
ncbi:GAF domain-containing protein [Kocuria sp. KRD140]|uniref:GAF domain-containing protein n=1 Tax=Kocuria sp. KRD140 TaxID=2729723 RepID=UPI001F4A070A|nr:GAF domain-containing protein [Kocuria sp. KRD140]